VQGQQRQKLKLTEDSMRRSPVKVGATCAALLLSSIAYAQQQPAPSQSPAAPTPATWTLFLVTVPYKGAWTVTSVAAFSTKDTAHADCLKARDAIDAIPGVRGSNADAKKAEGSTEYLICLPATAGSQQSRSGAGGSGE
jgi:hypothetical protein